MTTTQIKVRGYHEDRFGHVNNARYLEFLEEARWAHLEERGLDIAFFKARGIFPALYGCRLPTAVRQAPAMSSTSRRRWRAPAAARS